MPERSLKSRTAGTLKWNAIDRVASQLLYAVTGVVLARILSQEDFGLVGAVLVFQAFASLLVDSGFSYALLQRKRPSRLDYSTVLWFNLAIATLLYIILFAAAPLIADCFQGDRRIIPLSRVMFLSVILNASAIVQTNRLMKQMNVRMVAVSNSLGLVIGGVAGIVMAVTGWGAWAIVYQTLVQAAVKSLVLWTSQRWRPRWAFSWKSLRGFFGIGSRMMLTGFLNTLFLNIYAFFIGNRVGLVPLGYYTQSDKWSKMGVMSIYQVITSSFLPTLSHVQDDPDRFRRMCGKMARFTAYLTFPALVWLATMATPVFHLLFGTKWDLSIILFQILAVRGIFTVLTGLYNNYMLALGHARAIMWLEVVRDALALAALALTFTSMGIATPGNPVRGLEILLWGQLAASAIAWVTTLAVTSRITGIGMRRMLCDIAPYACLTALTVPLMHMCTALTDLPLMQLAAMGVTAVAVYGGLGAIGHSRVQREAIEYILKRNIPKK